jgi:GT2 family glycosyltransferase
MAPTLQIDGCVVIGRNEGPRLVACLKSVEHCVEQVVYADSDSCDGSADMARRMGIQTVELDGDAPFTAARGRNAGLERLLEICPAAEFVQFVDGDCEIFPNWFERARSALETHPDAAVVFGRLRERRPDQSVYNRLCNIEWDTPIGEVSSCGGIAMMRMRALRECGGFNEGLIAGEEPELCFRLREKGWKILRIDADMGWHDAAMTRFGQWWKRSVRAGHAYAECSGRLGESPERFWVHETRSIAFWGLLVPAAAVLLAAPTSLWSLWLLAAYPALAARIYRFMRRRAFSRADSTIYALFCTLGKFPQAWGVLSCSVGTMTGRHRRLIEYK